MLRFAVYYLKPTSDVTYNLLAIEDVESVWDLMFEMLTIACNIKLHAQHATYYPSISWPIFSIFVHGFHHFTQNFFFPILTKRRVKNNYQPELQSRRRSPGSDHGTSSESWNHYYI